MLLTFAYQHPAHVHCRNYQIPACQHDEPISLQRHYCCLHEGVTTYNTLSSPMKSLRTFHSVSSGVITEEWIKLVPSESMGVDRIAGLVALGWCCVYSCYSFPCPVLCSVMILRDAEFILIIRPELFDFLLPSSCLKRSCFVLYRT